MLDLFINIASWLQVLFSFVSNLVGSFIGFFSFIASSVPLVLSFTGLMPSIIGTCILLVLIVSIVKIVFGR